jgi:nucleotide-binding universal stress UspA family protein
MQVPNVFRDPAVEEQLAVTRRAATSVRVLLVTDASAAAGVAEAWIGRLRWAIPPRVDILCVARPRRLASGIALQTYRSAVRNAVADLRQSDLLQALRIANATGERLQAKRLLTGAWARLGDPVSEIGAMVRAEALDLVVLGSDGRRGLFSPPDVVSELIGQIDTAILVTRAIDHGDEPLPRRVAFVTSERAGDAWGTWLTRAGWLDGAEVRAGGSDELRERAPEGRPDLAVIGRRPGSRSPRPRLDDALEWASAVLLLPANSIGR